MPLTARKAEALLYFYLLRTFWLQARFKHGRRSLVTRFLYIGLLAAESAVGLLRLGLAMRGLLKGVLTSAVRTVSLPRLVFFPHPILALATNIF